MSNAIRIYCEGVKNDFPETAIWMNNIIAMAKSEQTHVANDKRLIKDIQGALNTEETGEALVEIARNAWKAEQELASMLADDTDLPKLEVCERCDIAIRPEGGHMCGTCGRNV